MSFPEGFLVTWFGHSTFLIQLPNGKRLLFDPFILENPSCPEDKKDISKLGPIDLLLITHGHGDHFSDALTVAKTFGCPVVSIFEIVTYLNQQGIENVQPMNKGGSISLPELGVTVTMTHAFHSSGIEVDGGIQYAGEPTGFIVTLSDGYAFYFAGDTALFSDMKLIAELYQPKLAFLPIGDRFTMGPREAAKAVTFLSSLEAVVPMHYGTFGLLSGTPEAFEAELNKVGSQVVLRAFVPGETLS